jgi:hypothetical protein
LGAQIEAQLKDEFMQNIVQQFWNNEMYKSRKSAHSALGQGQQLGTSFDWSSRGSN